MSTTLVVILVAAVSSSSVMNTYPALVPSAYSIPGFETETTCENAKAKELERIKKVITASSGDRVRTPNVTAECVSYQNK